MDKLLEGYRTILQFWQASENVNEEHLAEAMNLYTSLALEGKEYVFKEPRECKCPIESVVTFEGRFASFCTECGTLLPF